MPETGNLSLRQKLSSLRSDLKAAEDVDSFANGLDIKEITAALSSEDPKTRKNAALLLGDIKKSTDKLDEKQSKKIVKEMLSSYKKEETLFVRPVYLVALMNFDITDYKDDFEKELSAVQTEIEGLEEKLAKADSKDTSTLDTVELEGHLKHKKEELHDLKLILSRVSDRKDHPFKGFVHPFEILLLCEEDVRDEVKRLLRCDARITKSGVRAKVSDYDALQKILLYKELLFLIPLKRGYTPKAENVGNIVKETGLLKLVMDIFSEGKDAKGDGKSRSADTADRITASPYRFRLDYRAEYKEKSGGDFLKKLAKKIEEDSDGLLINEPGDYEFSIVFRQGMEDHVSLYIELPPGLDRRFSYRKNIEPTSMSPLNAARAIYLIKSYLSEENQVIDPMCGTGALLIERARIMPLRTAYGTDIYGHAIKGARENAALAGFSDFNFINRDFFDFSHDYPFQEIITELPDMYGKDEGEKESFFKKFFEKVNEVSDADAMLFVITSEEGLIRKHIRLAQSMKLVRSIPFNGTDNIYVIKVRT